MSSSLLIRALQLAVRLPLALGLLSHLPAARAAQPEPPTHLRIVGGLAGVSGNTIGLHELTSHLHAMPLGWGLAAFVGIVLR